MLITTIFWVPVSFPSVSGWTSSSFCSTPADVVAVICGTFSPMESWRANKVTVSSEAPFTDTSIRGLTFHAALLHKLRPNTKLNLIVPVRTSPKYSGKTYVIRNRVTKPAAAHASDSSFKTNCNDVVFVPLKSTITVFAKYAKISAERYSKSVIVSIRCNSNR